MILIACPGCGRRKLREEISNRPKRCTNCGAAAGKIYRHVKIWMDTDYDGDDRDVARQQTYGGLLWLATAGRYKKEWAAIKYKKLYGEWPDVLVPEAVVPRQELVGWAVSDKAKHAAAMRRIEKGFESGKYSYPSGLDLSDAAECA